jgi:hypothetical protein
MCLYSEIPRNHFAKHLWSNKLKELDVGMDAELEATLKHVMFIQELALIDLSLLQKSFAVALKYLKKIKAVNIVHTFYTYNKNIMVSRKYFAQIQVENDLELQRQIALSRAKWLWTEFVKEPNKQLELIMTALESLSKHQ